MSKSLFLCLAICKTVFGLAGNDLGSDDVKLDVEWLEASSDCHNLPTNATRQQSHTINPRIGDMSWALSKTSDYDKAPNEARVVCHLQFALQNVLKARGKARAASILKAYIEKGEFPQHDIEPAQGTVMLGAVKGVSTAAIRKPLFIDAHGTPCAVASLMQQTAHAGLASRVSRAWSTLLVDEFDLKSKLGQEVAAWAQSELDLSTCDLAVIQPTYEHMKSARYMLQERRKRVMRLELEAIGEAAGLNQQNAVNRSQAARRCGVTRHECYTRALSPSLSAVRPAPRQCRRRRTRRRRGPRAVRGPGPGAAKQARRSGSGSARGRGSGCWLFS